MRSGLGPPKATKPQTSFFRLECSGEAPLKPLRQILITAPKAVCVGILDHLCDRERAAVLRAPCSLDPVHGAKTATCTASVVMFVLRTLLAWHLPFGEPKNSRHGKLDRLIAVGACVIPGSHQDDVRSESHRQIDIEGASVSLPVRVYGIDVNMPSSYSVYR